MREHEPEVYRRIAHILLPKDYARYRALYPALAAEFKAMADAIAAEESDSQLYPPTGATEG